jgi:hypothetical protein
MNHKPRLSLPITLMVNDTVGDLAAATNPNISASMAQALACIASVLVKPWTLVFAIAPKSHLAVVAPLCNCQVAQFHE